LIHTKAKYAENPYKNLWNNQSKYKWNSTITHGGNLWNSQY